jgi:hypothetical protein
MFFQAIVRGNMPRSGKGFKEHSARGETSRVELTASLVSQFFS